MRASGASELWNFRNFHILILLFPSIFCWYFRHFISEKYLISGVNILHTYTINAVSFYYSWYGAIYKRQYTDKTLTLRKCMCMRASEASELRKLWYFYILKLLFLSIFCRYIRYFVGTNDMLVGLHVPTTFPMYRQISKCTDKSPKRHYWGGGGNCPPPPPLATLMEPRKTNFPEMELDVATSWQLRGHTWRLLEGCHVHPVYCRVSPKLHAFYVALTGRFLQFYEELLWLSGTTDSQSWGPRFESAGSGSMCPWARHFILIV